MVIAIVAAIRNPIAYGVGLALVSMPAVWYVSMSAKDLAQRAAAPSIVDQESGRGYFSTPADRALAEAIVAGDVAKVASLAPAANLNAEGWGGMTFMRLALENGHANHDVLAILLRNRIDPDQDASLLYQMIYNQKDEALLRVVIDSGVDLNKHMGRGSLDLLRPLRLARGSSSVTGSRRRYGSAGWHGLHRDHASDAGAKLANGRIVVGAWRPDRPCR